MTSSTTIMCHSYDTWREAHEAHHSDFCVYTFDLLPIDELCVPGIASYIGSAGANATREKESKTLEKSPSYIKGSIDARYRGGSYTKNHTRPQHVDVFTISRNICFLTETKREGVDRMNTPGFKHEERALLGVLEFQLHKLAVAHEVQLNNSEVPKCVNCDLKQMETLSFFKHIIWEGQIPMFIDLGRNELTLNQIRDKQKTYAINFHTHSLAALLKS